MKEVNMDETIKSLLEKYSEYVATLIQKEKKRIGKKKYKKGSEEEKKADTKMLEELDNSYKFLTEEVVKDPKKYLYHDIDMIYVGIFDDGSIGNITKTKKKTEVTVYRKLVGLGNLINRYGGKDVLFELSENIAHHIRVTSEEDQKRDWTCFAGRGARPELYVENILELNKYVRLRAASNAIAAYCGQFVSPQHFAAPLYPKKAR